MLSTKLMNASSVTAKAVAREVIKPMLAPRRLDFCARRLAVTAAAYDEGIPTRTFCDFSVYKGKAAVSFRPIPPTYVQTTRMSGAGQQYIGYTVDREGVLLMEFANVLPSQGSQSGYGNRSYDWQNKVTFAVKAIELAQIIDFDVSGNPDKGVELFHDPNKGSPDPNQVKTSKTLRFNTSPSGDGYMLNVSQRMGTQSTSVSVPISRAEYVVLKHNASYLIPRFYGLDMLFEGAGSAPNNIKSADGGY